MAALENVIRDSFAHFAEIWMMILFGSFAAGKERQESDVDIEFDTGQRLTIEAKMAITDEIAQYSERSLDLIDFRGVSEPLLGKILGYRKRLRGEDGAYAELIKRHDFAEADFMTYYRRILAERRNAWIASRLNRNSNFYASAFSE